MNVPVNEPLNEPVFICAELDTVPDGSMVGANEADMATLELCAQLAVPKNPAELVTGPCINTEPVN